MTTRPPLSVTRVVATLHAGTPRNPHYDERKAGAATFSDGKVYGYMARWGDDEDGFDFSTEVFTRHGSHVRGFRSQKRDAALRAFFALVPGHFHWPTPKPKQKED